MSPPPITTQSRRNSRNANNINKSAFNPSIHNSNNRNSSKPSTMATEETMTVPPPEPQPDRSPSPPPPPPIALTPGVRAKAFTELHKRTLTKTLSAISYPNFASCFPTAASHAPDSLKTLHSTFVERLEKFATDEFEHILQTRNVVENLNSLEDLVAEAKRRRSRGVEGEDAPMPPHLRSAEELVRSHLAPQLVQQRSQLNAKLQTTQGRNAKLWEEVQAQRREIEGIVRALQGYVGDLEEAGGKLGRETGDLRGRIREVDEEMAGV